MIQIDESLARLRRAASRVVEVTAAWNGDEPFFDGHASDDELLEFARRVGNVPPPDYSEYLKRCRRIVAMDVHNGYELFSPLNSVHGPKRIHVTVDGESLEDVPVFPIGGDGGGNLFLMDIGQRNTGRVWKWSHEHPPRQDGVAVEGLELIAASFSEFLSRVADDWDHFVDGDTDWPFL